MSININNSNTADRKSPQINFVYGNMSYIYFIACLRRLDSLIKRHVF